MVGATALVRIARPTAEQPDSVAQMGESSSSLMEPIYDNRRCRLDV